MVSALREILDEEADVPGMELEMALGARKEEFRDFTAREVSDAPTEVADADDLMSTSSQQFRTFSQMVQDQEKAKPPTPSFVHRIQTDLFNTFMARVTDGSIKVTERTAPLLLEQASSLDPPAARQDSRGETAPASAQSSPLPSGANSLRSLSGRVQNRRGSVPNTMRRMSNTVLDLVRSGGVAAFDMAITGVPRS